MFSYPGKSYISVDLVQWFYDPLIATLGLCKEGQKCPLISQQVMEMIKPEAVGKPWQRLSSLNHLLHFTMEVHSNKKTWSAKCNLNSVTKHISWLCTAGQWVGTAMGNLMHPFQWCLEVSFKSWSSWNPMSQNNFIQWEMPERILGAGFCGIPEQE